MVTVVMFNSGIRVVSRAAEYVGSKTGKKSVCRRSVRNG